MVLWVGFLRICLQCFMSTMQNVKNMYMFQETCEKSVDLMDPWRGLEDSLTSALSAQCSWGWFYFSLFWERAGRTSGGRAEQAREKSQCKGWPPPRSVRRQRMPGVKWGRWEWVAGRTLREVRGTAGMLWGFLWDNIHIWHGTQSTLQTYYLS